MYIFVTSILSISCIILYMVKLFHIKIRKISFCHNSSIKISNPHPPNVILMLSMATWVWMPLLNCSWFCFLSHFIQKSFLYISFDLLFDQFLSWVFSIISFMLMFFVMQMMNDVMKLARHILDLGWAPALTSLNINWKM